MNNIIYIQSTSSIGDSLSSINLNYETLDLLTKEISQRANDYLTPVVNYYKDFKKTLKEITTISQTYSSILFNACTIVETNSAGWLKPITIFFPSIFNIDISKNDIVNSLQTWASNYFPEITLKDGMSINNYVENQKLIVYAHRWEYGTYINENQLLTDYTLCQTASKAITINCKNFYTGFVYCSNGNFNCVGSSSSCTQSKNVKCSYDLPPYVRTQPQLSLTLNAPSNVSTESIPTWTETAFNIVSKFKKILYKTISWTPANTNTPIASTTETAYGYIKANVEMFFQDRNEVEDLIAVVFSIKGCAWKFERFLTK